MKKLFLIVACYVSNLIICQQSHLDQFVGAYYHQTYGTITVEKIEIKKKNSIAKIVITGAPGSGKTSIMLGLQGRGEHIIREAATDYIMYNQAQGNCAPWEKKGYCLEILEIEKLLNARIHPDAKRVFTDRGFYDSLAYLDEDCCDYQEIFNFAKQTEYALVFFIDQLDFHEQNDIRREDRAAANALSKKTREVYEKAGYELITIKKGSLQERVDAILYEVNKRGIGLGDTSEQTLQISIHGLSSVLDYVGGNLFNNNENLKVTFTEDKKGLLISSGANLDTVMFKRVAP